MRCDFCRVTLLDITAYTSARFILRSVYFCKHVVLVAVLLLVFSIIFFFSQRFNILQESLIKLVEACNDQSHNMDRWLSKLEASNWLTHIKEILTAACLAAQCIDR